jgi:hypothetical protein
MLDIHTHYDGQATSDPAMTPSSWHGVAGRPRRRRLVVKNEKDWSPFDTGKAWDTPSRSPGCVLRFKHSLIKFDEPPLSVKSGLRNPPPDQHPSRFPFVEEKHIEGILSKNGREMAEVVPSSNGSGSSGNGESARVISEIIPVSRRKVFLCHSARDKPVVRELYRKLNAVDLDVWFDEKSLLPGQDWASEIRKAVKASEVVLVCVSRNWTDQAGFIHKEIRIALDVADEQPEGRIFIIPVRLDDSEVPERLSRWHCASVMEENWLQKLLAALNAVPRR